MDSKKSDAVWSLRGRRRAISLLLGFVVLVGAWGCSDGSAPGAGDEAVASESEALATPAGITLFDPINVGVCFHGGSEDVRIRVRAAIERTWGAVTRVHFSNWSTCPANPDPSWIPIRVNELSDANAWGGNCKSGRFARQPGDSTTQFLIVTGANRVSLEAIAVHEMGHCLGATHEHQRSDTPVSCQQAVQVTPPTGTGPCTQDSDCSSNDCGSNNRCVLRACPGTMGCFSGFTCNSAAQCVPNSCKTASDCFGSSFCINGRCNTSCSTDSQCPNTHFCDRVTGRCVDGNTVLDTNSQNLTPWDSNSIMLNSSCRTSSAPEPSFWDIYGMQRLYGSRSPLNQVITSFKAATQDYTLGQSPLPGYVAKYAEGWIWARGMPGTVPLDLYFHSGRGDYWALASSVSRMAAQAGGYVLQSTIGHVYASSQPGTVELRRYRHPVTLHRFTAAASSAGEAAALAAGYTLMGVEGYIFPATSVPFETLTYYWSSARNNSVLTRTGGDYAMHREDVGYENRGLDGITLKHAVAGTRPLRQFYHSGVSDDFAAATNAGLNQASDLGYVEQLPHEGYIFETLQNDTTGLKLLRKSSINDYWNTAERTNTSGYEQVRIEGYVIPALW